MEIRELKQEHFPLLLREIPDPPKRLFAAGELPGPDTKHLSVVGSRKYTEYGRAAVEKLVGGLRGYDICIVSGLALGIDALAHRAALNAGLKTIAVPGSGLDPKVLYPRSHLRLAEEIVEAGGALLSEFEPGLAAATWTFPQRNRIMAGLSHAVLVIEAEIKSGTLITSKLATEYNRDVLTVPGSIFSSTSEGPHMLIKLGATPVTNSEDILRALGFSIDAEFSESRTQKLFDLSPDEEKVVVLLRTPIPRDELLAALAPLGINTTRANVLLSTMEIKGIIAESMGEMRLA